MPRPSVAHFGSSSCSSSGSRQHHHGQQRRGAQCVVAAAAGLVGCKLVGVGSSAPETVLSNADLEKFVETNDEWIATRTGIRRRHVLAEGETMSTHAAAACKKALEMAGVSAEDVNIVLVATSTPDDAFGSACSVSGVVGCVWCVTPAALQSSRVPARVTDAVVTGPKA